MSVVAMLEIAARFSLLRTASPKAAPVGRAEICVNFHVPLAGVKPPSVTIALPMGRQNIAVHLGLTIETVSRILARWIHKSMLLDLATLTDVQKA